MMIQNENLFEHSACEYVTTCLEIWFGYSILNTTKYLTLKRQDTYLKIRIKKLAIDLYQFFHQFMYQD